MNLFYCLRVVIKINQLKLTLITIHWRLCSRCCCCVSPILSFSAEDDSGLLSIHILIVNFTISHFTKKFKGLEKFGKGSERRIEVHLPSLREEEFYCEILHFLQKKFSRSSIWSTLRSWHSGWNHRLHLSHLM